MVRISSAFLTASIVLLASSAALAGDDSFSLFESQFNLQGPAVYSAGFDRWLKDYLAGRDKEADQDWADVVKTVKSGSALFDVMYRAMICIDAAEGDEKNPRRNHVVLLEHLLSSSQKKFGKNCPYLNNAYNGAAQCCYKARLYSKAAEFYEREFALQERLWGKESPRLADTLCTLIDSQERAKQWSSCETSLQRLNAIAQKTHDQKLLRMAHDWRAHIAAERK